MVQQCASLAATGALSGVDIAPGQSRLDLVRSEPIGGDNLRFVFERAEIAEEGLLVMVHMLFAVYKEAPFAAVEVITDSGAARFLQTGPKNTTSYPGRYARLPFALDDRKPEGGAYSLVIHLERPLEAPHEAWLNAALGVWIRSVRSGGYALAPLEPAESYVEPDSEAVTSYGETIEWAVFKVRADPACIDGLINICGAFDHRAQKIRSVQIE
jgi:hypothetical protein